jgi:hypothetical protein
MADTSVCYHDLVNSSNAGLDMSNRTAQYYTEPGSTSAAIICLEECPTEKTMAAAGKTLSSTSSKIECDPTDPYCKEFCLGGSPGNPYGLFEAGPNDFYATNNQDRGNCYDGDDMGMDACTLSSVAQSDGSSNITEEQARQDIEAQFETGMLFAVNVLNSMKNAALDAAGIGAFDDWEVVGNSNWEACKAAIAADPNAAATTAACANTGCPQSIYVTYDLPAVVRNVYHPCVPSLLGASGDAVGDALEGYLDDLSDTVLFQDIMTSVGMSWQIIAYCMAIAIGLSYLMVIGMKFVIRPLIVILLIVALLLIFILMIVLWGFYYSYRNEYDSLEDPSQAPSSLVRNKDFFHVGAILWSIFTAIMFLLLIALRKKIWVAATLYMEASKAMFSTPSMLISPIIHWISFFAVAFAWIWVAILIASSGDSELQNNSYLGIGHALNVEKDEYNNFLWFHIFMGFWGFAFLSACHEFVLAGCITNWYKYQGADEGAPGFAYFRSMWRLARYHLGTVALGSLIIAIVQMIIAILTYIKHKAEKNGGDDGIAKFVLKMMICCTVLVFRSRCVVEDDIGSHICWLEASIHVFLWHAYRLSFLLPAPINANSVQTLKACGAWISA